MKKNSTFFSGWRLCWEISLAVLAGILITGCTHTAKVKVESTARIQDPAEAKIPLHVALVLDDHFSTNTVFNSFGGDRFVYPVGPALRQQAVSLCEQTFQRVAIVTNGIVPSEVNGILTPEIYRTGFARSSRVHLQFTLLVQWTLSDPVSRNVLWMHTVDAQGADIEKRVFQLLCDDFSAKSYRAIQNSPEIKRLSAKTLQAKSQ